MLQSVSTIEFNVLHGSLQNYETKLPLPLKNWLNVTITILEVGGFA